MTWSKWWIAHLNDQHCWWLFKSSIGKTRLHHLTDPINRFRNWLLAVDHLQNKKKNKMQIHHSLIIVQLFVLTQSIIDDAFHCYNCRQQQIPERWNPTIVQSEFRCNKWKWGHNRCWRQLLPQTNKSIFQFIWHLLKNFTQTKT